MNPASSTSSPTAGAARAAPIARGGADGFDWTTLLDPRDEAPGRAAALELPLDLDARASAPNRARGLDVAAVAALSDDELARCADALGRALAGPTLSEEHRAALVRVEHAIEAALAYRGRSALAPIEDLGGVSALRADAAELRRWMRRTLVTAGSYAAGRASIAAWLAGHRDAETRRRGRAQLALLDAEAAEFRGAFLVQVDANAQAMLDAAWRAVAAALQRYGLELATWQLQRATDQVAAEPAAAARIADAWIEAASSGEGRARYAARASQRRDLAWWAELLLIQRGRAHAAEEIWDASWSKALYAHSILAGCAAGGAASTEALRALCRDGACAFREVLTRLLRALAPLRATQRQLRRASLAAMSVPAAVQLTATKMFVPSGSLRQVVLADLQVQGGRPCGSPACASLRPAAAR
ncbi:MAG: hypothetical protein R3B48_24915 [Kofleriaceae bacterium]